MNSQYKDQATLWQAGALLTLTVLTAWWATPLPVQATDLLGGAAPQMLSPEEAQERFTLAEGYEINLYASEVDFPITSPAAMTFDAQGRLWVSCVTSHPHARPDAAPRDSLVVLEDQDRDGVADHSTVFYDQLYLPMGFAVSRHGREVYIVSQPNLLRLRDLDGDLVADETRIELHGLGTEDNHHVASAFQWGPDGRLYFSQGLFLNTQIETPHGPVRAHEGAVFRWDPRDHRLRVHASYGWSNPWGLIFDHWGQALLSDASPSLNYYLPYMSSRVRYPEPNKYDSATYGGTRAGFTPSGRRPSCGNELLLNEHFPEDVRGWYVTNQMKGWHGVRWYRLHGEGAGYASTQPKGEEELLTTTDITFRPTALQVGPDGALYVLDYYNPIVGHTTYNFRDPRRIQTHGRVWRIQHKERPLVWQPEIRNAANETLLEILRSPNHRWRYFARRELQERPSGSVLPTLDAWTDALFASEATYEHHLLEALWVYQGHDHPEFAVLESLLTANDSNARAGALRVLRDWQFLMPAEEAAEHLARGLADPSEKVRLEALLACGDHADVDPDRALELAMAILDQPRDAGSDLAARETLHYLAELVDEVPEPVDRFLLPTLTTEALLARPLDEAGARELLGRKNLEDALYRKGLAALAAAQARPPWESLVAFLADQPTASPTLRSLLLEDAAKNEQTALEAASRLEQHEAGAPQLRSLVFSLRLIGGDGATVLAQAQADGPQSAVTDLALLRALAEVPTSHLTDEWVRFASEQAEGTDRNRRLAAYAVLARDQHNLTASLTLLGDAAGDEQRSMEERFAAMAAIDAIPLERRPPNKQHRMLIRQSVEATPALKFKPERFEVPAGSAVELEFFNPDNLYHNLVIIRPEDGDAVGVAADAMAARPDGMEQHYVPDHEGVLHWTPQLGLRKRHRLRFFAPSEPGEYPYLCTFPGHWRVMRGVMHVTDAETTPPTP